MFSASVEHALILIQECCIVAPGLEHNTTVECNVCGKPVNRIQVANAARKKWKEMLCDQAHLSIKAIPARPHEPLSLNVQFSKQYLICDLVADTVHQLAHHGGTKGRKEIKKIMPTFDFVF